MKKRRLFLLLLLFSIGISIPQATHAMQKETAVSIQFASSTAEPQPVVPPRDQLPSVQGKVTPLSNSSHKFLPQTGEVLRFTGELVGTYMIGLFLLLVLLRRRKEEDYET